MALIDRRCNSVVPLSHSASLLQSPLGRRLGLLGQQFPPTRTDAPPKLVDVAVIGGGLIGCALACQHLSTFHEHPRLIILESGPSLLGTIVLRMEALQQRVMRSPYEHQLAPDGTLQLIDYARLHHHHLTRIERLQLELGITGQRAIVPVDVFLSHTAHVLAVHELARISYRFSVNSMERSSHGGCWLLRDERGRTIRAKAVIVATGGCPTEWPRALSSLRTNHPHRVQSVYTPLSSISPGERIAVVGSGLSAGHAIQNILRAGGFPVWIMRSSQQYRCADVDTSFFRTEGLSRFNALSTMDRLKVLRQQNAGSLMLELHPVMERNERLGRLEVHRNADIQSCGVSSSGKLTLLLSTRPKKLLLDRVVVAVGLRPNVHLLNHKVELHEGLYPAIDSNTLELGGQENLFAAGLLASLALGPAAKNVDGARLAVERLIPLLARRFRVSGHRRMAQEFKLSGFAAISATRSQSP